MSKITSGRTATLKEQVDTLHQVEMRMMHLLACYEGWAGPLDPELVKRTTEMLMGQTFTDREEMYKTMLSVAKTVQLDLEFEQAAAEAELRTLGTESNGDTATQLYVPDILGK